MPVSVTVLFKSQYSNCCPNGRFVTHSCLLSVEFLFTVMLNSGKGCCFCIYLVDFPILFWYCLIVIESVIFWTCIVVIIIWFVVFLTFYGNYDLVCCFVDIFYNNYDLVCCFVGIFYSNYDMVCCYLDIFYGKYDLVCCYLDIFYGNYGLVCYFLHILYYL